MAEKKKERTDRDRLRFLANLERMDRSGQDCSWAFEFWCWKDKSDGTPGAPMDVRLSPRGCTTRSVEDLVRSVDAAMDLLEDGLEL